jgi:hypothetical protein
MMRYSRILALVALGAAGSTGGLVAQVVGLPVRNAGIGTGIGIAADVGFPNRVAGNGIAFGGTGAIGLGPVGFTASVASYDPKGSGEKIHSVGGTGNLKVFGGPLVPVSITLQGGLGYHSESSVEGGKVSNLHVPVGVGLTLTIPNPAFSIKPWVAPRLDLTRTKESGGSIAGSSTDTQAKFAISGGVDFGFLSGLSVRAMYDQVQRGNGIHTAVVSLGLGFRVGT